MILLYGVSGFTGRLIAAELVRRGAPFLAGGRDMAKVREALARAGLPTIGARAFAVDDEAGARAALVGATLLLNCAGPFGRTAVPLAKAAVAAGVPYLDLAGEVDEHVAVGALDGEARAAGVALVPGVGFGVAPTEIAAAEAARRLGSPVKKLAIAYVTLGGTSRGTLETVLRSIHHPGVQRRGGMLVAARPGEKAETLDFGGAAHLVVTNPWRADIVAAARSTRAEEVETSANFPLPARLMMRFPGFTGSSLGRFLVDKIISGAPEGPSPEAMAAGATLVRVDARGEGGAAARVILKGPDAYAFTAATAAILAEKAAAGRAPAGWATPSMAMGFSDLLAMPGVAEIGA